LIQHWSIFIPSHSKFGTIDLSEVKESIGSIDIVRISLLIELDVITNNRRSQLRDVGEVKGFKNLIQMRNEISNCLLIISIKGLCSLSIDNAIHDVPAKVLLDIQETMKSHCLGQDSASAHIIKADSQVMELVHRGFKSESLSEGKSHGLDLIRHLIHPNIIEFLAFSHDLLLEGLHHGLGLSNLTEVYKIN
jgi:hypothetical protein